MTVTQLLFTCAVLHITDFLYANCTLLASCEHQLHDSIDVYAMGNSIAAL